MALSTSGAGQEDAPGNDADSLDLGMKLGKDAQSAIVACRRGSSQPLRDFFLDQQHDDGITPALRQQGRQQRRGDVVRDIGDNFDARACGEALIEKLRPVECEGVRRDNPDLRQIGNRLSQRRQQITVHLRE